MTSPQYPYLKLLAAVALLLAATSSALADEHDHDHDDAHPDLSIELEGQELHLHGFPVVHSHDKYVFEETGGRWLTMDDHSGLTFPGIGAAAGTLPPNSKLDLAVETVLYYWDGADTGGFGPAGDGTYLEISKGALFDVAATVDGDSLRQVLTNFISVESDGGVHMHPLWELFGPDADPANGAYLFGVSVAGSSYEPSGMQGVLLHKGLTHDQYESAVDHALAAGVPEPATLSLLGLGAAGLLRRRRRGR